MKNLIDKCEETIRAKFFCIPNLLENCKVEEFDGFQVTKSPYLTSMFNISWLNKVNPIYLESSLKKLINYFSPNPFSLWLGPNSFPLDCNDILTTLGFTQEANETGMIIDLNYSNIRECFGDVNKVTDISEVIYFIEVLESYDSFVREYYLNLANHLGFSDLKPYHLFYIKAGNKTACIASLFFHQEICGIFDVLTHDDFRKQGYASNIMRYLLYYAKNHGAKYISLTASSKEAVSCYVEVGLG